MPRAHWVVFVMFFDHAPCIVGQKQYTIVFGPWRRCTGVARSALVSYSFIFWVVKLFEIISLLSVNLISISIFRRRHVQPLRLSDYARHRLPYQEMECTAPTHIYLLSDFPHHTTLSPSPVSASSATDGYIFQYGDCGGTYVRA